VITIECESVQLQLITTDDLELIRHWRNSPHVVEHMQYQNKISEEDQKRWFENLDKNKNLYFKIVSSNVSIGIIHLKEIDWRNKTAEAGVFIGEGNSIGTITPMISILVLMKTAFKTLGLNKLFAKISKTNTKALQFNQQFGYEFLEEVDDNFEMFVCTKNNFYKPNSSISRIQQLFTQNAIINIYVDIQDIWILEYLKVDDNMFRLYQL